MAKKIVIKEFILSLLLFFVGYFVLNTSNIDIMKHWTIYSVLLFVIFLSTTILFYFLKKKDVKQVGWIYAGTLLVGQILLLLLLFITLDPTIKDHKFLTIISLVSYLFFLILDTKWKIKWLFSTNV